MPKREQHQAICVEVIRELRREREKRGLSKYAVSQQSGVSQSMLSLIERDMRNPSLETLLKIAEAIGVDLSAVLKNATAKARGAVKNQRGRDAS